MTPSKQHMISSIALLVSVMPTLPAFADTAAQSGVAMPKEAAATQKVDAANRLPLNQGAERIQSLRQSVDTDSRRSLHFLQR